MKQISVKQAQKWLQKLKNEDLQAYKDITKFLKKYQKTQDQYDCFVKINNTLLNHPKLTQEINIFMEEGNKMVINKEEQEKIKQLIFLMKKNRPEIFSKTISIIQEISNKSNLDSEEINNQIKIHIKQTVKDDPELMKITQQALQIKGQQLIAKLSLQHLKNNKGSIQITDEVDDQTSKAKNQKVLKKQLPAGQNNKAQTQKQKQVSPLPKPQKRIPFTSISQVQEQRYIFKQLEKLLDRKVYFQLIKVLRIYYLNIITKNEVYQMIKSLELDQQLQFLKDIIESREADRRRFSVFKPLNDLDFSHCERISPSYSLMPISYPNRCFGRTDFFKKILNDVYVSVPHGSQENFNIRFKNSNQLNLLKSEDQRYQFDLYMRRLYTTYKMLNQVMNPNHNLTEDKIHYLLQKVVAMGTIQLIYKNCSKEQREELEWLLKSNQQETLRIFKDRIQFQIKQMENIKSIHALKAWQDVAVKNFTKALDLKGFQFKKNQKQRMKSAYFITQLHQRASQLMNKGQSKNSLMIPFQDRKQFFTILNSFEASSRNEKCLNRQLPEIKLYDLQNQSKRKFYPVMVLAFENKSICQKVYSLINYYIDNYSMGDSEKLRCKFFLSNFLINFMGWQTPMKRYLNHLFDEEKLFQKINGDLQEKIDFSSWISQVQEDKLFINDHVNQSVPKFNHLNDEISPYVYLPEKSASNKILYGSEQLYAFLRFIYTLYERIIKLEEVAESQQNLNLFEILFFACIKVKEGLKFQQNLTLIFGKSAYLFSTIYKLCDNLIRILSSISNCVVTAESMRLSKIESQQIYLLLLNKYCLLNQLSNNKIIRLAYQPKSTVIYINLIESFYKIQENPKQLLRKRIQISRGIDIYTFYQWYGSQCKKKRKLNQVLQKNDQEYLFESSTIKMVNHQQKQDILCFVGKSCSFGKNLKKEFKRATKINELLN